jgi:DNA-binding HxlR family transcriptional regulator
MSFPEFRSPCPVASALDLFGDKWTLVVLRTIFAGRHTFSELADIPERIASNILSDRLDRLERFGLVSLEAYQEAPVRYRYGLTRAGADVLPILQALADWSAEHIPGRWTSPPWFSEGSPQQFYPGEAGSRP